MPTVKQYETVQQQVLSFAHLGCATSFEIGTKSEGANAIIKLKCRGKDYCLSDQDWEVIIAQLACLYKRINKLSRV